MRLRIKDLYLGSDCYWSTLNIRDGQNSSSDLLKKYCGDDESFQDSMFSSGRYLRVQFKSEKGYSSYVSKFDAVFEAVKQGKTT